MWLTAFTYFLYVHHNGISLLKTSFYIQSHATYASFELPSKNRIIFSFTWIAYLCNYVTTCLRYFIIIIMSFYTGEVYFLIILHFLFLYLFVSLHVFPYVLKLLPPVVLKVYLPIKYLHVIISTCFQFSICKSWRRCDYISYCLYQVL